LKEFYVLHGPRGEVHSCTVGGREHVAVWPDMLSALRYKSRRRELLSHWAVPLNRRLYEELVFDGRGGHGRFYLMSGANPGAEVELGRALPRGEIERRLYAQPLGGVPPWAAGGAPRARAAAADARTAH
jgi:hypothetical protein